METRLSSVASGDGRNKDSICLFEKPHVDAAKVCVGVLCDADGCTGLLHLTHESPVTVLRVPDDAHD